MTFRATAFRLSVETGETSPSDESSLLVLYIEYLTLKGTAHSQEKVTCMYNKPTNSLF
jgi:hypothetical protein